jgi:copper chaperone
MQKENIRVEGMSCGHCKMTVENAAGSLPGVESAKVNLKKGTLTVKFNPDSVALDDIKEVVSDAGYSV